jgi:hypothetical protein
MLLRSFAPEDIEAVDWSFVKVRLSSWPRGEEPLTVWMHTPHQGTRADHPIYRAVGAHPGKHPRQEGEHAGT